MGPDDALVKSYYCGICGSDITNFKYKLYQVPLIMGHEFAGEVVEIGENVFDVKIGDKVACINVSTDISGGQLRGLGIFQDGGFAEYVKVPSKYLFNIPENVSIRDAILIESFANATRAMKLSGIRENQNIVIMGGGNIGLTFLKILLIEKKPKYAIIVEPHEFLRERAKEMGATDAYPPNKVKIKKFIKEYGEPTFIFDCVGIEKTLIMAVEIIKKGGTILLEGFQKGSILFPTFMINSKEINLKGCLGHDKQDILAAIDLFVNDKVDANEFISEIVHLKDIQKTFEKFLEQGERKFIKIIIKNF
ncbi:MAG: zinc-binding dehydrogenase [Promethearchaeota archaeon]